MISTELRFTITKLSSGLYLLLKSRLAAQVPEARITGLTNNFVMVDAPIELHDQVSVIMREVCAEVLA